MLFQEGGFNIQGQCARMAWRVLFKGVARTDGAVRDSRRGLGSKMRFSWAVAALLAGFSVSGFAQQAPYKVKPSHTEKPAKSSSAPVGKAAGGASASAANAKSLESIEHESAKTHAASQPAAKKSAALKPVKDKPNPPMNFGGSGGAKSSSKSSSGTSAYKGRVRQKGAHQ